MFTLSDTEFIDLASFVKINYGLELASKRTFVEMRIQKLMAEHHYDRFCEYFSFVCNDLTGMAISRMISGLTVNYTLFFRESFHFEYMIHEILPNLIEREKYNRDLRIWSAGCSTGEEPYTLAIIVSDFLGINKPQWDMKILATDISNFALEKALLGVYPAKGIEGVPPEWAGRYFTKDPADHENVHIAPIIKNEVIFRKHNMVKDPYSFKQQFHMIFCRNVMIYFDEQTKDGLLKKFDYHLHEGGYLFIGMSETIDTSATNFEYVAPSIYRKKGRDSA